MFGNGYVFVRQRETSDNSDAQNLRKVVWWFWVTRPKPATVAGLWCMESRQLSRSLAKAGQSAGSQELSWPQAGLQHHLGIRRKTLTVDN